MISAVLTRVGETTGGWGEGGDSCQHIEWGGQVDTTRHIYTHELELPDGLPAQLQVWTYLSGGGIRRSSLQRAASKREVC